MNEKTRYYVIRIISVLAFFYGIWLIYAGSSFANSFLKMKKYVTEPETVKQWNSLIGYAFFVSINGLIGLIGSFGLFKFKKFGFYLISLHIFFIWILSWGIEGQIRKDWLELLFVTLVFIYLIIQRKFIFEYSVRNNNFN